MKKTTALTAIKVTIHGGIKTEMHQYSQTRQSLQRRGHQSSKQRRQQHLRRINRHASSFDGWGWF